MAVDENARSAGLGFFEHIANEPACQRVHAVGGFIENDELGRRVGAAGKGLGQADTLPHPLGIASHAAIGGDGEIDTIQQGGGAAFALGALNAAQAAEELDHLPAGQVGGELCLFGQISDVLTGGLAADGPAKEPGLAAGGADQTEQALDERAFAGAVGTKQAEDFAAAGDEVDAIERGDAAFADHSAQQAGAEDFVQV